MERDFRCAQVKTNFCFLCPAPSPSPYIASDPDPDPAPAHKISS